MVAESLQLFVEVGAAIIWRRILGTIFVGSHPISKGSLQFPFFGHLFLLYSEDGTPSEDDMIIRGGPNSETGFLTVQYQITQAESKDSINFWGSNVGLNGSEAKSYYGYSEINLTIGGFGVLDASAVW
jgi:hypothetical protein